jgi:hypothetical protein
MKSTIIALMGVSAAALLLYWHRKGIVDKANALLPPMSPNTQHRECNCASDVSLVIAAKSQKSIFPNGLINQYSVPAFSSVQKK